MSVAVISSLDDVPEEWLRLCVLSVASQTLSPTHILVGKEIQRPLWLPNTAELIGLPKTSVQSSSTAKAVGAAWAIGQGFDAVTWLDADGWLEPNHLESLWKLHVETGAAVCTSGRKVFAPDGSPRGQCPHCDGKEFADSNGLMLTRDAFRFAQEWVLHASQFDDSEHRFWEVVRRSPLVRRHSGLPTLCRRIASNPPRLSTQMEASLPISERPLSAANSVSPSGVQFPYTPSVARQSISLCMIVRNEESNIEECLRTVSDLVDETIVVDTGSQDRTGEIAARCGAKVFSFPWIDDFAAARNESLRHALGDWIFWMDADDRLDGLNRERFRRLRTSLPDGNFAFMMKQRSKPEHSVGSPLVVDHARLFRRLPEVRWRYRLHEQILPSLREAAAKMVFTDLVIDHLGYADPQTRRGKLKRNLRILQLELQDRPGDAFVSFNMAGTLLDIGERSEAIPHLEDCIRTVARGASFAPKAHVLLVKALRTSGNVSDAERRVEAARKLFPTNAELLFEEGLLYQHAKNPKGARQAFEAILGLPKGPQFVGTDEGVAGHLARHNLALSLRQLGEPVEAERQWRLTIGEAPHFSAAWLSLLDLLLEKQRFADAEALVREADSPRSRHGLPAFRARLLLARNQPEAAADLLENALAADPQSLWLRLFLCDVLSHPNAKKDRLEHHLREALAIDPNHPVVLAKLQELSNAGGSSRSM